LRCLVCQNESLAGSHAELANDLRREIRTLIKDGRSDNEIMEFMVSRYGDFVRYRPPLKGTHAAAVVRSRACCSSLGLGALVLYLRRRARAIKDTPLDRRRAAPAPMRCCTTTISQPGTLMTAFHHRCGAACSSPCWPFVSAAAAGARPRPSADRPSAAKRTWPSFVTSSPNSNASATTARSPKPTSRRRGQELQRRLLDEARKRLPPAYRPSASGSRTTALRPAACSCRSPPPPATRCSARNKRSTRCRRQARMAPQQIEEMLAGLVEKLKQNPDDSQGLGDAGAFVQGP
jgi:hypothetical protein